MRETRGLVDSLVGYIQNSLQEGQTENKVSYTPGNPSVCADVLQKYTVCVWIPGSGELCVCAEEPVVPAVPGDPNIRPASIRWDDTSSEHETLGRHRLL